VFKNQTSKNPKVILFRFSLMDPLANVCSNFEQVGQAFVSHYYNTFDANRSHLGQLYKVTITTASLHLLPSELAKWFV